MLYSRRIARTSAAAVFAGVALAIVRPSLAGEAAPALAADGQPALAITARSHDFGTVDQGTALRHRFVLVNRARHVVTIQSVEPQCTCTTIDEWPRTLAPGATGVIAVTVDTARFAGPITKAVHVVSSEPTIAILEIKANVWTPIAVSASTVVFPAVTDPTQSTTRTVTLRNQRPTPVSLGPAKSADARFKVALREITPGREAELTIATVPPLPDGTHSAEISVATSDPALPELRVGAVVTVLPAVQVVPQAFTFNTARLAAAERRFAVLLNHRSPALRVTDVATNAPGVELATTVSPDRKQVTITLTFPAGFTPAPGLWLRGKTTDPALPVFEIPIGPAAPR